VTQVKEILPQSVQSIYLEVFFDGTLRARGTGFVVKNSRDDFYLVTNRHIVTGREHPTNEIIDKKHASVPNRLVAYFNKKNLLGEWIEKSMPLLLEDNNLHDDKKKLWLEHPRLKDQADVIALKLEPDDKIDFLPWLIEDEDNSNELFPTDIVSVVGFPFGVSSSGKTSPKKFAVWATGFIASETSENYNDWPVFLIDSRSRQGQSGSPVIIHRNPGSTFFFKSKNAAIKLDRVLSILIGIYSGRIDKESDIGMVWKMVVIKDIIEQ
jgi:hypothetical protein